MDPTLYAALATIIAALIAGLVAYMSSVLSKEAKTSEFRYSWLNAVLDDTAKFIGGAESMTATSASLASAEPQLREALAAYYRARIRLYPQEHANAVRALDSLQALLLQGGVPDRLKVDKVVREVVQASHAALKQEWGKVKRGEPIFRVTKYISLGVFLLALASAIAFGVYAACN